MTTQKTKKESFEVYFTRLQDILDRLETEAESMPLEEMLELYQESLKLVKLCKEKLNEAELKIKNINDTEVGNDTGKEIQSEEEEDNSLQPF
jgi:exodeoxyribonuclease VII small subunit